MSKQLRRAAQPYWQVRTLRDGEVIEFTLCGDDEAYAYRKYDEVTARYAFMSIGTELTVQLIHGDDVETELTLIPNR